MTEEQESRAVLIPGKLYRLMEQRAMATGFGSVEEYVMFILEEVVGEEAQPEEVTLSEQDEEEVKQRLKALGYL